MKKKERNKHFIKGFSTRNPERDYNRLADFNEIEVYCGLLNLRHDGIANLSEVQFARYVRLTEPEVIRALLRLWLRGFVKIRFNVQDFRDLRDWIWMHGQKALVLAALLIAPVKSWWGG